MRAHIFQHLPIEGPGNIQPWLANGGFKISYTHFFSSVLIPEVQEVDFLIIMGGSMSVNDEDKFPWLVAEKQYLRDFIKTGKPVLGICLGSQMIASALGAGVYPNNEKEIGWFPVKGLQYSDPSIFSFPGEFIPLHWHGETFDLPEGAVLLATSEACKHQAFQFGKKVLALQFHPEATRETLQDFVHHFKNEIIPGEFIQSESEILAGGNKNIKQMVLLMNKVLRYLVS
jgi:GMP synthase-like glutamine amidotransferase